MSSLGRSKGRLNYESDRDSRRLGVVARNSFGENSTLPESRRLDRRSLLMPAVRDWYTPAAMEWHYLFTVGPSTVLTPFIAPGRSPCSVAGLSATSCNWV